MKRWLSVAFFAGWRVVCLLLGLCQPDAVPSVNGYDHTASWSRSLVCFVEPAQASHTAVCKALDFSPHTKLCQLLGTLHQARLAPDRSNPSLS
jgi:hypothetical protein